MKAIRPHERASDEGASSWGGAPREANFLIRSRANNSTLQHLNSFHELWYWEHWIRESLFNTINTLNEEE